MASDPLVIIGTLAGGLGRFRLSRCRRMIQQLFKDVRLLVQLRPAAVSPGVEAHGA